MSELNQFLLNETDLPLFNTFGEKERIPQLILAETIRRYSSQYVGKISPYSVRGCQLLASKLKDSYDLSTNALTRNRTLSHNYMGTIAKEAESQRTLLAFDHSWILAGIAKYIDEKASYEMDRPIRLREKMASLQGSGWTEVSDPKGEDLSLQDLTIYRFEDLFMVFAPVSLTESGKVLVYLKRNIKLYDSNAYIAVKDMPLENALDLKYLFPLEIGFAGNYVLISSDQMTQQQLEKIHNFGEMEFSFPGLDELRGAYGTYLLSEALFYEFSIRWEDRKLYVGLAGYIQAKDISEHFGTIMVEVNQEVERFDKYLNYESAVAICQQSNCKGFYYLGNYYVAIGPKMQPTEQAVKSTIQMERAEQVEQIEAMDPLRAAIHPTLNPIAKRYLKQLGYITAPNPQPLIFNLNLGYRTYEIVGEPFTSYYYKSSYDAELEIYEGEGYHQESVQSRLTEMLNSGQFFTQKIKNIMRGYPGFIPGDAPIRRLFGGGDEEIVS